MDLFETLSETFKPEMDLTKISNIEFDGINHHDYPKYADVYIVKANYKGELMNESQLNFINKNSEFIHECFLNYLH